MAKREISLPRGAGGEGSAIVPSRLPLGDFKVRCEACFYRSRWPTPDKAAFDALRHQALNTGHSTKILYPPPVADRADAPTKSPS